MRKINIDIRKALRRRKKELKQEYIKYDILEKETERVFESLRGTIIHAKTIGFISALGYVLNYIQAYKASIKEQQEKIAKRLK